ncbi:MAG: VWA domain-containing protein [Candidatus Poribacteria bacterium]|nr:VWA domain-containing protein [Candidatus Poribacteria bacterium]
MVNHGTLLQEITVFCRLLKQIGVNVTTTNQISFCRSLEWIDITQRGDFYHAARTNLIASESDRALFDTAFNLFWKHPRPALKTLALESIEDKPTSDPQSFTDDENIFNLGEWGEVGEDEDRDSEDAIAYSPNDVLTQKDFSHYTPADIEEARQIIAKFASLLATKLSRRRKVGIKGNTIDFRCSWRKNIAYGGEPLKLIRKRRKVKKYKILLLCDVSASMDCYSKFLIQFIFGMQREIKEIEAAIFSTRLTNITGILQRKTVEDGLREIAQVVPDWSGGTKIGESLIAFYREFAPSFSAYRSVVILISDGWDRGDPELLRTAMEMLHRRAYRVIWLNPLLGSEGYQPLCRGIRTALLHVDYFLPAHNLKSLLQLTKVLTPIWSS